MDSLASDEPGTRPAPSDGEIYEGLRAAVIDHRLAPGTKLAEEKLGQVFGVSRTRIRQVLIRLAHEQIVTLAPNRGAAVAQLSVQEAREVFEVRRLIEPTLLARCIERATAADMAALEAHIDAEEQALGEGNHRLALTLTGSFHLRIAEVAAHRTLGRVLHELISRTSLVLMSYGPAPRLLGRSPGRWTEACNCRDHRALLAAIRARDVDAACRRMTDHLQQLEDGLSFEPHDDAETDLAELLRPAASAARLR